MRKYFNVAFRTVHGHRFGNRVKYPDEAGSCFQIVERLADNTVVNICGREHFNRQIGRDRERFIFVDIQAGG